MRSLMANLLMRWIYYCSDCEKSIALKTGESLPIFCWNCKKTFEEKKVIDEVGETYLPPTEAYLEKIKNL